MAQETGRIKMQMLPPDLDRGLNASGMNFGIFARESGDEARQAAEIGAKLKQFAARGLTTVMLDMAADETEMQHVCKALGASRMF